MTGGDPDGANDVPGTDVPGTDVPETPEVVATWVDPATGLTWQRDPGNVERSWAQAIQICHDLEGGSGWRLPDIDELRSLIRGCPDTVTGGPCNETVQCSGAGPDCYDGEACMGCGDWEGPGQNGCFWPAELDGPCEWYWSSTTASDITTYACFAHFRMAHLSHDDKANALGHHVICVR